MKRILSVLLCVLIAVCVSAVPFGAADIAPTAAAGFAKITMCSMTGETVTKNYAVGDVVTATTFLNMSRINGGKVGSISGYQQYDKDVLEPIEATDATGVIIDIDPVLPILSTKGNSIARINDRSEIVYNGTIATTAGYVFNTNTSVLLAVRYRVIAPGTATLRSVVKNMAQSDLSLTKVVIEEDVIDNRFTMPVALSDPALPLQLYTLSGSIKSYLDNSSVTTELMQGDTVAEKLVSSAGTYSFPEVARGGYTLRVSKNNHVSREYPITVSANTAQDVKLHPIGDINGDGKVSNVDYARANSYFSGMTKLDDYQLKCGDVVKNDGKITNVDLARINSHVSGMSSLWTL